ncbi:hypothetical protein BGX26_005569 [Mortierella sp. AD094]|nr:hypothetical protein BGX26_005569 [Mortierella sp. AD094]
MVLTSGMASITTDLWNGEYFIQLIDLTLPDAPNSNLGCHIDQMLGQNAAWQLGLPRVFDKTQANTALASIYTYNFVPDLAAYRAANTAIPGGRWYAMADEPAMIVTTFPHGSAAAANGNPPAGVAMYFNESWTGQEYQLAAQMIYEGMVDEGLIVTRAVHNRYALVKRNPYNEIECSEHYTRAMTGYGVFLAACGFSCHGPQGRLTFAPRIGPYEFAAAFTSAGGWVLFRQQRSAQQQISSIEVRYGQVRVAELQLQLPAAPARNPQVQLQLNGRGLPAPTVTTTDDLITIGFAVTISL